jgi:hypothetical protein
LGAAVLLNAAPTRAAAMVGVLLEDSSGFYAAVGESFGQEVRRQHPSADIVIKAPPANKMARCNSARRFVSHGAALLVLIGPEVTVAAISDCDHPLVYAVYDVAPFAPARSNATGAVFVASPAKLLGTLYKLKKFSKLGVVALTAGEATKREVAAVTAAAKGLNATTTEVDLSAGGDLGVLDTMDAVYVAGLTAGDRAQLEQVATLAMQRKSPVVTTLAQGQQAGALITMNVDAAAIGQQTGQLVAGVLGGRAPSSIPPVAKEAGMILNLGVAKALGLAVPDEVKKAVQGSVP